MTTRTIARREAIGRLALGSLGVAAAPVWLEALTARAIERAEGWSTERAAAAAAWKPKALTAHQAETVATIAELIVPQTETAGARAARVHEFIDEVLYDEDPGHAQQVLQRPQLDRSTIAQPLRRGLPEGKSRTAG